MTSLKKFAQEMDALSDELDDKASDVSKQIALEAVKWLTVTTRVDTSNAISNWQIGLGAPPLKERLPFYPGKFGSTMNLSGPAAIEDASQRLASKKSTGLIYISNLAPYINRIDHGFFEGVKIIAREKLQEINSKGVFNG